MSRRGTPNPWAGRPLAVVHDLSLVGWAGLALAHALRHGRPGGLDAVVAGVNLLAGVPDAADRVARRRRDPVALAAPVAVAAAVLVTARARGGWVPVATTGALLVLASAERLRETGPGRDG